MGQAKLRSKEIDALKASGTKKFVPSTVKGFKPDAGLNSGPGTNHYWFQTAELIGNLCTGIGFRSYMWEGTRVIEIATEVDIMDKEGKEHRATQLAKGYFATFRLSPDKLDLLADMIDRGGMSVRVDGYPAETGTSPAGEQWKVIDVEDIWSEGNHSGFMSFYIATNKGMIATDSHRTALKMREIAADMRANSVA